MPEFAAEMNWKRRKPSSVIVVKLCLGKGELRKQIAVRKPLLRKQTSGRGMIGHKHTRIIPSKTEKRRGVTSRSSKFTTLPEVHSFEVSRI
ncbi:hypothetical protein Trydic_g8096 [Trypoxylus dichotomus]